MKKNPFKQDKQPQMSEQSCLSCSCTVKKKKTNYKTGLRHSLNERHKAMSSHAGCFRIDEFTSNSVFRTDKPTVFYRFNVSGLVLPEQMIHTESCKLLLLLKLHFSTFWRKSVTLWVCFRVRLCPMLINTQRQLNLTNLT